MMTMVMMMTAMMTAFICVNHLYNHDCPHYQKADISTIVDRLTDTSKYGGTHKVITRKGKDSNLSLMRVKFNI